MRAFGFKTVKTKGDDIPAIDLAITECKAIKDQRFVSFLILSKVKESTIFEEMAANHSVKFDNEKTLAQHREYLL